VWADVRRFYGQRANAPRWLHDGEAADVESALRLIRQASEHGLDASGYDEAALARMVAATKASKNAVKETIGDDINETARFDVRVTTALLALGRDVALGRNRPDAIAIGWEARRTPPDLAATLAKAGEGTGTLDSWLNAVRPVHPEYAALQKVLASLRQNTGVTDGEAQDKRIQQIALNMDRWRWMPDDLGARHIMVNIPAYYMSVREDGRPVLEMKVVVGKADHKTPIFSGEMSTIVFSPYWNVPESIAEGETAPAAAKDPDFLRRNGFEILHVSRGGTTVVDPDTVQWDDPEAIKELVFRQKPGAGNALGHVKFLFPNKYNVYLHDTPADALFERGGRALSHGCVRLEKPEALARYVLRDRPEWDAPRIRSAMHAGVEKHLPIEEKLAVHLVYFTVWPNASGGIDSWPDVYGHDAKQAASSTSAAAAISSASN
jgi:murein L,D-transpeptidase YcbB/YkuD